MQAHWKGKQTYRQTSVADWDCHSSSAPSHQICLSGILRKELYQKIYTTDRFHRRKNASSCSAYTYKYTSSLALPLYLLLALAIYYICIAISLCLSITHTQTNTHTLYISLSIMLRKLSILMNPTTMRHSSSHPRMQPTEHTNIHPDIHRYVNTFRHREFVPRQYLPPALYALHLTIGELPMTGASEIDETGKNTKDGRHEHQQK